MSASFETLIARGLRADQPAAGQPGRLYHVTDEDIVERDNGSTWDFYANASTATGGITHEYLGYDTVGGSQEGMTQYKVYAKKITVAQDSLITSIDAHVICANNDNVASLAAALYTDITGAPGLIIAGTVGRTASILLDSVNGAGGMTARWLSVPCNAYLTAGDYWIAVQHLESAILNIFYDGSGSDRFFTAGGAWFADWGWYSPTTGSNKYSIRASLIR